MTKTQSWVKIKYCLDIPDDRFFFSRLEFYDIRILFKYVYSEFKMVFPK